MSLVARAASGSFRDAVSALDQLATACSGPISVDDVRALLGTTDAGILFDLIDRVAAADAAGCLIAVDAQADAGSDLGTLVTDLLAHLRLIFLQQQLGQLPAEAAVTDDERARVASQAERLEPATVHRLVDLLRAVLDDVREGADPRLPLELALVRTCRPAGDLTAEAFDQRLSRLEAALQGSAPAPPPASPPPPAPVAATPVAADPPAAEAAAADAPAAEAAADASPGSRARRAGGCSGRDAGRLADRWHEAVVPEVSRRSAALGSLIEHAVPDAESRRRRPRLPQVPAVRQDHRRHPAEPRAHRVGARAGGRRAGAGAHGGRRRRTPRRSPPPAPSRPSGSTRPTS